MSSLLRLIFAFEAQVFQAELASLEDVENDCPAEFRQHRVFNVFDERVESLDHFQEDLLVVDKSVALVGIRVQDLVDGDGKFLADFAEDPRDLDLIAIHCVLLRDFLEDLVNFVGVLP